jgi:CRP-like cAMP-binding protein
MARVSAFDPARRTGRRAEEAGSTPGLNPLGPQPDLFSSLSPAQANIIRTCSEVWSLDKGDLLFLQGQPHSGVFIIESGIIRTFFVAPKGREITLAYWKPGNLVGTPQVLSDGVHRWSGEAVVATRVLVLKTSTLRSLIAEIPQLALAVIEALEYKGKCFSGMVQMLGTMSVSERILEALRTLADVYGEHAPEGIVLRAPFTHEAIANMVGASRQWVTAELHSLEEKGIVRVSNRSIIVNLPSASK